MTLDLAALRRFTQSVDAGPWTLRRSHDGWDIEPAIAVEAGLRAQEAMFIAATRNALPALLDRIERLERVAEAVRSFIRPWDTTGPYALSLSGLRRTLAALDEADD